MQLPIPLLLSMLHRQRSASFHVPMGQIILTEGERKSFGDLGMLITRRWAPQG